MFYGDEYLACYNPASWASEARELFCTVPLGALVRGRGGGRGLLALVPLSQLFVSFKRGESPAVLYSNFSRGNGLAAQENAEGRRNNRTSLEEAASNVQSYECEL